MSIPGAFWWIIIPILIAVIMPVIAQFYPTNEFFWSALVVAIGGAIVAALKVWRDQSATPAQPPPGVASDTIPMEMEVEKSLARRSAVGRWFWG